MNLTSGISAVCHVIFDVVNSLRIAHTIPSGRLSKSKTLLLLIGNAGYFPLTANCIRSFQKSGVSDFFIASPDAKTSSLFDQFTPNAVALPICPQCNEEYSSIGTSQFNAMMYFKLLSIFTFSHVHPKVLYCDGDVIWLKNAIQYLPKFSVAAFQPDERTLYDAKHSSEPKLCAGFFAISGGWKSRLLIILAMLVMRLRPSWHDQDALNWVIIKLRHFRLSGISGREPRWCLFPISVLDPNIYPNGSIFFTEFEKNKLDMESVAIIHANYTIGFDDKVEKLKSEGLWI